MTGRQYFSLVFMEVPCYQIGWTSVGYFYPKIQFCLMSDYSDHKSCPGSLFVLWLYIHCHCQNVTSNCWQRNSIWFYAVVSEMADNITEPQDCCCQHVPLLLKEIEVSSTFSRTDMAGLFQPFTWRVYHDKVYLMMSPSSSSDFIGLTRVSKKLIYSPGMPTITELSSSVHEYVHA